MCRPFARSWARYSIRSRYPGESTRRARRTPAPGGGTLITVRGWAAVTAATAGLALAVVTMSYLLILTALAIFAFLAADILAFHATFPRVGGERFHVVRTGPARRVTVGGETRVIVTATYHGARGFWGEILDVLPSGCAVVAGQASLTRWWTPGETVVLDYTLRVLERGRHTAGPTSLLAVGPLGMSFVRAEMAPGEGFLGLPPEPSTPYGGSTRALYTRVQGRLNLRRRGFGSEIRSLRPYEASDDIRNVAWRRSTPEDVLVREYEQEGRQDYVLVFDVSRSMAAGPDGATALDLAASAGRLVARLVERSQEDRVGLLSSSGDRVEYLAPGRGQGHFSAVDERLALLNVGPGGFDVPTVFEELLRRLTVQTHVFVFTALSSPSPRLAVVHRRMTARGHHLCFFTPDLIRFSSHETEDGRHDAMTWARRLESDRARARWRLLRGEGIPTFAYDAYNISGRVLSAYSQVRGWGRVT